MEFPNSDTKKQPATEPGLKSIYKNIFSAICIVAASVIAQYGYGQSKTANDRVPEYNKFLFGTNLGWYPPWDDYHVADVALGNPDYRVEGMGATSLRPVLYEHFLEKWGYDARLKV
ncbi:MAG: hypothetical protein MI784_05165, partial [Cytophagales bacterium]|nr:hypothetical protein [Cytophagales bacterium]